ncbi:MAG: response regulator [Myxococcaceae bacterium]
MAADPYKYFRVEAKELSDELSKGVLRLEKGADEALVAKLLRLAHTLKGAARVVKQTAIAEDAHGLEDLLQPFRAGGAVSTEVVQKLLARVDAISAQVQSLSLPQEAAKPKGAATDAAQTVRADVEEVDRVLDGLSEAHTQLMALRTVSTRLDRARGITDLLAEQSARGRAAKSSQLAALASELRSLISAVSRDLSSTWEQLDRELRQVRDAGEQLRLVSASTLFSTLERTARDGALSLGKEVAFSSKGGEVRLDAHVLEGVRGALLQLCRNAVAHGLETPDERRAAKKPAEGRLEVTVTRLGRRVQFAVLDDGRGVDVAAVRQAARKRGLGGAGQEPSSAGEWLQLLLRGGLSTTEKVTELSGRGVGLDVVRAACEQLKGTVTASTTPGKGTTFVLTVPLSLASLEGLVVESAEQPATLPLDAVRATVRLSPSEIFKTPTGEAITYEHASIPFVPLSRLLKPGAARAHRGIWSAVVVEGRNGRAAIGVDRLLGTGTVVLRPVPEVAEVSPVVAGASVDAEGRARLVLDPDALVAAAQASLSDEGEPLPSKRHLLVIDDSLTTRMLEQSILEAAGYQVDLATSAEEGLVLLKERPYALCLVDVEMPGMDGFTFIEKLRADPVLRTLPAILVTSRDASEDLRRGEAVGAQGYVVKGQFDQAQLLARIKQLVGS